MKKLIGIILFCTMACSFTGCPQLTEKEASVGGVYIADNVISDLKNVVQQNIIIRETPGFIHDGIATQESTIYYAENSTLYAITLGAYSKSIMIEYSGGAFSSRKIQITGKRDDVISQSQVVLTGFPKSTSPKNIEDIVIKITKTIERKTR